MDKQLLNDRITTTDSFSLKFDGENEIDASLLGLSISNLAFVVNKIAETDVNKPECCLKVSTFRKGSFEILFSAVLMAYGQQSMNFTLADASMIIGILRGMLDLKKFLKGERPATVTSDEKEGTIHVVDPYGSDITVPIGSKIVITESVVDRKVSEITESLLLHNPEGGFSLTDGEVTTHYDREAVQDIARPVPITEFGPTDTVFTSEVTLPIHKIDLLGASSWSFKYGTRGAISAVIEDKDFLKSVHSGKNAYKAGDKLTVEMTIRTKLSDDGIPIREKYTIEKVLKHIPATDLPHGVQLEI